MSKSAREPSEAKLNLPNLLGSHVNSISQCPPFPPVSMTTMDNIRTVEGFEEVDVENNGFVHPQEFDLSLNI